MIYEESKEDIRDLEATSSRLMVTCDHDYDDNSDDDFSPIKGFKGLDYEKYIE